MKDVSYWLYARVLIFIYIKHTDVLSELRHPIDTT